MKKLLLLALSLLIVAGCSTHSLSSEKSRRHLEEDAREALETLYKSAPGAKALGVNAKGILVFPSIVKGGFLVGGQYGQGVLLKQDEVTGYYESVSGSFGLQAGLQKFGYVMFFMSNSDLDYLVKSDGWEIGAGPTVTVLDKGFSQSTSTLSTRKGVYTFFFEQRGLMAGLGLQGTKISRVEP